MATPVTGFVIEAIGKMVSLRMGGVRFEVLEAVRLEVGDASPSRDDGDGAGDPIRVDSAPDQLADPLETLRGQAHVFRRPGGHLGSGRGDREQGNENERQRQAGDEAGSVTDTVGAHRQLLCSRIDP